MVSFKTDSAFLEHAVIHYITLKGQNHSEETLIFTTYLRIFMKSVNRGRWNQKGLEIQTH